MAVADHDEHLAQRSEKLTLNYAPTQPYDVRSTVDEHRLLVPPPYIELSHGRARFYVETQSFERTDARCGNPQFLSSIVTHSRLDLDHVMLRWQYSGRQKIQAILPFLSIGPASEAKDAQTIQNVGITYLLSVRNARPARKFPKYLDPAFFASASPGIQTATFDIDSPYELITNIRPVVKSINDHLEAKCVKHPMTSISDVKGNVLVFCETGNEKSAVFVAAYLMVVFGIDPVQAIQVIQSQRFCINVGDDMKNMLVAWNDILSAERGVATSRMEEFNKMARFEQNGHPMQTLPKPVKRSFGEAEEDDESIMDVSSELADGDERAGMPPFTDISD